jgi:riboflavin kinase/FMN adenylyltransferase
MPGGCVATIGNFDGVHLGHRQIIARVIDGARARALVAAAFTFEPTPREYFARGTPPARLTRFREKFAELSRLGLDCMFCPPFDVRMERLSPDEFIDALLVGVLNVRHLVIGDDFRFAHRRSGTVEDLRRAGLRYGFTLEHLDSVTADGERVSSTAIRAALAAGDLDRARRMLGRWYSMAGRVVRGLSLGRQLGYPTANVDLNRRATAVAGIFAVRVKGLGAGSLDGVASVGCRPTVDGGGEPLLEVHIFDFDRDIYGASIVVEFVAKLRDEERFPDLESLTAQMHIDAAQAREILSAA